MKNFKIENEFTLILVKNNKTILNIPLWNFPNATFRECYETENEIIIVGDPIDENHNCDFMGCSSCFHVKYRFRKI